MFRLVLPLFSALLCCLVNAFADFTITQKEETEGRQKTVILKLKGDQIRIDGDPRGSFIFNTSTGESTTLLHPQKLVVKMTSDQVKEMTRSVAGQLGITSDTKLEVQATGKKDKINGYEVAEYTGTIGSTTWHSWVAKDYPNYKTLLKAMNREPLNFGIDMSGFPGMSIKSLIEPSNQPARTVYLESVKEGIIDPAEFRAPADYRLIENPAQRGQ